MKKTIIVLLLFLCLLFFSACGFADLENIIENDIPVNQSASIGDIQQEDNTTSQSGESMPDNSPNVEAKPDDS